MRSRRSGRVENDALVVLVGDLAHAAEVVHRNGLSAGGVVCDRHDDERYLVGVLGKTFPQLVEIHVALEGHFELGVLCLVDGAVYSESLAALDVTLGGVEVRVARNDVAFLHEVGEKHVLGSAALVGGDHILEACDAGDSILQLIERACTCVALVSGHHRRPLAVAHRACTRVGDTVDVNLIRTEHEHIVFGSLSHCSRSSRVLFLMGSTILIFHDSAKGNSMVVVFMFFVEVVVISVVVFGAVMVMSRF